jgi:hypothetical protein
MFRTSARDGELLLAAIVQAALTALAFAMLPPIAAAALFGLGLCWGSNTVSHNHLHNPLFRSRALNRVLSLYLSVLYAIPQSVWRDRHLWHHAGEPRRKRRRLPRGALTELVLIVSLWGALVALRPALALPLALGWAFGVALCRLQGNMEHALCDRPERGISHYGRIYNRLWFNDGHHAEHHRWPALHWTLLPARRAQIAAEESRLPPLLGWLEPGRARGALLGWLEKLALASALVRRFMLATHERAFARLLPELGRAPESVAIIGGGLFPRTAIVLRRLLPDARLVVVDKSSASIERARQVLREQRIDETGIEFRCEAFLPSRHTGFDLVIAPLAFVGDRRALLSTAVRAPLVTHDWLWAERADASVTISWLLLKRLSLNRAPALAELVPLSEAA